MGLEVEQEQQYIGPAGNERCLVNAQQPQQRIWSVGSASDKRSGGAGTGSAPESSRTGEYRRDPAGTGDKLLLSSPRTAVAHEMGKHHHPPRWVRFPFTPPTGKQLFAVSCGKAGPLLSSQVHAADWLSGTPKRPFQP